MEPNRSPSQQRLNAQISFPFPATGGKSACVAVPQMGRRCTLCAQKTIQRLLPTEVASSEAERRQTQPGLKVKDLEASKQLADSLPPPCLTIGIPSKVKPHSHAQRNVPICAHPTARLLSTAGKSPSTASPCLSLLASLLWLRGDSCPSLSSAGTKCIPTTWAGEGLGWQLSLSAAR